MSDLADAIIESQRVEIQLLALGYDRLGVARVQQEIADLHLVTKLSWHEATERVMTRIHLGESHRESHASHGPAASEGE